LNEVFKDLHCQGKSLQQAFRGPLSAPVGSFKWLTNKQLLKRGILFLLNTYWSLILTAAGLCKQFPQAGEAVLPGSTRGAANILLPSILVAHTLSTSEFLTAPLQTVHRMLFSLTLMYTLICPILMTMLSSNFPGWKSSHVIFLLPFA